MSEKKLVIKPKGLFAILNKLKNREHGSLEDVQTINSSFERLTFQNILPPSKNDFTRAEMVNCIQKIANHPDKTLPRIIFIMTHGNEDFLEDGEGAMFGIYEVLNHLSVVRQPALKDTFKMVVVLSCRGENCPEIHFDATDDNNDFDQNKNLAVAFSCLKDKKSVRFDDGSPFIKVFCDVFVQEYTRLPVVDMFEEIKRRLTPYIKNNVKYELTPEFKIHGLSEKFKTQPIYYSPSRRSERVLKRKGNFTNASTSKIPKKPDSKSDKISKVWNLAEELE